MLRSRFSWLPLVAGSVSLIMLTGCPNAGTQPPLGSSASPSVSPATGGSPDASSTSSPSANPGQTGNGNSSASPAVTPSAGAISKEGTTLRGKVYDEDGAVVSGAKVRVRSLNTSVPFDTTVDVNGGAYVVNEVPSGTQVEITASKDRWTTRTRIESLLPLGNLQEGNTANFGGPIDNADEEGAAYFISDFPEVVSAIPDAKTTSGEMLSYKITLSEPLDSSNQSRFEDYLQITSDAIPNGRTAAVLIEEGSDFNDDDSRAEFAWDTDGRVLTITFNAPLYRDDDDEFTYRLRFKDSGSGNAIEDNAGNDLGFTAPGAGGFYTNVFRISSPTVASTDDTDAKRWDVTHSDSASFDVTEDEDKPTLQSVSAGNINIGGTSMRRFSLTFSEPMGVYGATAATSSLVVDPDLSVVTNYIFAIGEDDLNGTDLDTTTIVTNVDTAAEGQAQLNSESAFTFDPAVSTARVSTNDPKVVWVTVPAAAIPLDTEFFKVRVLPAVGDPAGNVVSEGNEKAEDKTADNVKAGTI
jgi:hypothetical protein